jgi:hypothetical protein
VWKLVRFTLFFSAILLITPWLASYAYGTGNGVSGHETVHVEAAEPSKAPRATLFGRAIGSVTPGDLFYIDAAGNPRDITVRLYLTNAHELTPYLRYLILEVGIYSECSDGHWRQASFQKGNPVTDTFITLRNSPITLILAGYTRYKVTIDSGSFYCLTTNTNGGNVSPHFYLTAEPV